MGWRAAAAAAAVGGDKSAVLWQAERSPHPHGQCEEEEHEGCAQKQSQLPAVLGEPSGLAWPRALQTRSHEGGRARIEC